MPRINLLPWREQQRAERKKAFGVGMFGAMIGGVVVAGIGWVLMNQAMAAQRDRNQDLRSEIAVVDKQIEEINSLEAQKRQHIARMQIIESLERARPEIVHVFDTFTRIIPDGVYLTSLQQTGTRWTIKGFTPAATLAGTFMRSIDQTEWLTRADVADITENNFTLYADQTVSQVPQGGVSP